MTTMKYFYTTTALIAATALIGCADGDQTAEQVKESATAAAQETKTAVASATESAKSATEKVVADMKGKMDDPGADLSDLPSGTYTEDQGHAYIAFSYSHQGYSEPILRWGETDATIVFDNENPEASTLNVTIPVESIDSGVEKFDEHLLSADFFEAETYPTITFTSTDVEQALLGSGSVTGDLTIKEVTKPVTFKGKVTKVGKNFQSGVDMFGISATGHIKRSDFGVDAYTPNVGDDVEITIEMEFAKEGTAETEADPEQ
ncbi:YceI family protein [Litorimonas haliclonae]|uniref:YceI family protein n=1 Tax=Litorimonas haliclonae TaxID=2081977 RepID=UPI0039EE116C